MAPPVVATPLRARIGRAWLGPARSLTPLARAPIDHDLDGAVALEVLLEIGGQSLVVARDDEQEAIVHLAATIAQLPRSTALIVGRPWTKAAARSAWRAAGRFRDRRPCPPGSSRSSG